MTTIPHPYLVQEFPPCGAPQHDSNDANMDADTDADIESKPEGREGRRTLPPALDDELETKTFATMPPSSSTTSSTSTFVCVLLFVCLGIVTLIQITWTSSEAPLSPLAIESPSRVDQLRSHLRQRHDGKPSPALAEGLDPLDNGTIRRNTNVRSAIRSRQVPSAISDQPDEEDDGPTITTTKDTDDSLPGRRSRFRLSPENQTHRAQRLHQLRHATHGISERNHDDDRSRDADEEERENEPSMISLNTSSYDRPTKTPNDIQSSTLLAERAIQHEGVSAVYGATDVDASTTHTVRSSHQPNLLLLNSVRKLRSETVSRS